MARFLYFLEEFSKVLSWKRKENVLPRKRKPISGPLHLELLKQFISFKMHVKTLLWNLDNITKLMNKLTQK